MHLCLFEDDHVPFLRPLVETRAAYDLRLGLRTVLETTRDAFEPEGLLLHARPLVADVTRRGHDDALVNTLPDGVDVFFVNGRLVAEIDDTLSGLKQAPTSDEPRVFVQDDTPVAAWVPDASAHLPDALMSRVALTAEVFADFPTTTLDNARLLHRPWHLLDALRPTIVRDVEARTAETPPSAPLPKRSHATVHDSVTSVNPDQIHLGSGSTIRPGALLNAEEGPIYIGENATVSERAVVRGPCVLGPKTKVKIGANLEGLAAGPWCKLAGEIHDCVVHSFSNKSHAGFLGHAYLGQWCNLGADTNNSNMKNDYGEVSVYVPERERFENTGRQSVGLFMGDHSKCGINTMFNTGTVIGTNCNVFGGDFPPRYVPPFSWSRASHGFTEYRLEKALEVAEHVMGRRDTDFTEIDRTLLTTLFEHTRHERTAPQG